MNGRTAWNIYYDKMLPRMGFKKRDDPEYFSEKGIVLDYYRIRTEVCREVLEIGHSEFLERLKKRNGVLYICVAIVQDVWNYLSENGRIPMPDISLSSPLALVEFKMRSQSQYSMYWDEALQQVTLSVGDIEMINDLLSYGEERSLARITQNRDRVKQELAQKQGELKQVAEAVKKAKNIEPEYNRLVEKKRKLESDLENVAKELERARKEVEKVHKEREDARHKTNEATETAYTPVPEPLLPRLEPSAHPELPPENPILEEERRQMDELRRETAESVERSRAAFCQSTSSFQGTFVESLEKCRAQMDELLSRSSQEMCSSIRGWQQELYQIEFVSFAQMYINLCMVIRGAKRRMNGMDPSGMTVKAWSEELEKQQKNLERIQASMENALSGMGMAVIRPQPGTFFDPYFHTKEDGGSPGMGRKIKRCILPGVLRIRADKEEEVLFQAEVEVEE